mmetsp:Transcript_22984/g.20876  ORF Transcript_22984/g.20876 Transcript_22984/m.20876 type:complete len:628 (+) Transcript_22984:115-1998(+)
MSSNLRYKTVPSVVNGHTFTVSQRYNFQDSKILGRGSFGVVSTAVDTENNKTIAIKRIRPFANDDWDARHTLREIRLLRVLGPHPNIITLYGLSINEEKSELYMMMELMDCDLHRVIQSKQTLTVKHHKCFIKQIIEGIKAMHEVGVFHRDLKPGNILVSKDCQVRITDFGLARFMDESTRQGTNKLNPMTEYVVTRWYRAPELLLSPTSPYDEAIDMWSIGCILAELMRRKPLFPGKSHTDQVRMIFEVMGFYSEEDLGFTVSSEAIQFLEKRCTYRKQPLSTVVSDSTIEAIDLLEDLLSVNPSKRPSASAALQSAFLRGADVICDYSKRYLERPSVDDFDFEQEKYSLDELKSMIYDETLRSVGKSEPDAAARLLRKSNFRYEKEQTSKAVYGERYSESENKEDFGPVSQMNTARTGHTVADTANNRTLSKEGQLNSSIRGMAVGSIISSARNLNASSPNPRTPQTPSQQQINNILNKDAKNRQRLLAQQESSRGANPFATSTRPTHLEPIQGSSNSLLSLQSNHNNNGSAYKSNQIASIPISNQQNIFKKTPQNDSSSIFSNIQGKYQSLSARQPADNNAVSSNVKTRAATAAGTTSSSNLNSDNNKSIRSRLLGIPSFVRNK